MNSLVVLLSVVAFAVAKPSGVLNAVAYSSPLIAAAPAAVSSQSRIDIKTSPAVVSTAAIAPIARTVIAEPTLIGAYAAPAAIAPTAVSSQSRIDIKSTPAITTSVISAAPLTYSAPAILRTAIATPALTTAYAAPAIATAALAAPAIATTAYAAPTLIKTAALTPAAIAAPAVPLETPEVIAARAAHLQAKVLAGAHLIRKRSVVATPLISTPIATPIVSTYAATPLVSAFPLTYSAPLALSTPLITKTYSVHPW